MDARLQEGEPPALDGSVRRMVFETNDGILGEFIPRLEVTSVPIPRVGIVAGQERNESFGRFQTFQPFVLLLFL